MVATMRLAVVLAAALALPVTACAVDTAGVAQELAGTPDEAGVCRLLNDPATTLAVLDDGVPLDRRAAVGLIAHRNGPDGVFGTADDDLFDSLAEVDAVPYVGPVSLQRLIDYARAHGLVPGDDDPYGTFDGVAFTWGQARASLDLVNGTSEAALHDDVRLDPRAVASIAAARPIATVAELADLYYVGPSMLTRIRDFAAPGVCDDAGLEAELVAASDGMLLLSESDYPLEGVSLPGAAGAQDQAATMLDALGQPAGTVIEPSTEDDLVRRLKYESDPDQVDALRALIDGRLTDVQVWRVGTIQVHIYVVGTSPCGGLVGLSTVSIET
jgi:Nuclease A inhibitor-like protein